VETPEMKNSILMIGHSKRTIEEFIGLIRPLEVTCIVDIRSIPRSFHNPQFNKDSLPAQLKKFGIKYIHLAGLGGFRHANHDSVNTGWRNDSFRGFADYMQTLEFETGLRELLSIAEGERTAVMCAEAMPWRCHRSLIADALLIRGVNVEHIISPTDHREHILTSFAKVQGTSITYPAVA
jgi:uncharacterized protein (DUF488 family)